jgi:hypothetical protein
MQRKSDYFQQWISLGKNEQQALLNKYNQKFRDFDNDIIVNSAAQTLVSLGVNRNKLRTLQVGPERRGQEWSLRDSPQVMMLNQKDYETPYFILSIPTNGGAHSVAAVIDNTHKAIYYLDSLHPQGTAEAKKQLERAWVPPYKIIDVPADQKKKQQDDNITCGIHSAANIVGIIRHLEMKQGGLPAKTPSTLLASETNIDIENGKGIAPRSRDMVEQYKGVFCLAYSDYSTELEILKVHQRKKKTLQFAFQTILSTDFKANVDLTILVNALKKDVKADDLDNHRQSIAGRTVSEFAAEFKSNYPQNPFIRFLEDSDILAALPADYAKDSVAEKEAIVVRLLRSKLSPVASQEVLVKITSGQICTFEIKRDTTFKQFKDALQKKDPALGGNFQLLTQGREIANDRDDMLMYPLVQGSIDFQVRPRAAASSHSLAMPDNSGAAKQAQPVKPNAFFKNPEIEKKQQFAKLAKDFVTYLEGKLPPPRAQWDKYAPQTFVSTVIRAFYKDFYNSSRLKTEGIPPALITPINDFVRQNPLLEELKQHKEFAKKLSVALCTNSLEDFVERELPKQRF